MKREGGGMAGQSAERANQDVQTWDVGVLIREPQIPQRRPQQVTRVGSDASGDGDEAAFVRHQIGGIIHLEFSGNDQQVDQQNQKRIDARFKKQGAAPAQEGKHTGHARKQVAPYFALPNSFARIFNAWSTSFSVAIYGSRKRSTVSCVQLINSPSAMASSTICFPGLSSSTPIISPKPRTSLTNACLRANSFNCTWKYPPTR